MKIVKVPDNLPLEQYLAIEEDMVKRADESSLFTWIVPPTVIYGRHQLREQEVNGTYCETHNVRVVQRNSGGGCVYADEGNLMVSFVSPSTRSQEVFAAFLSLLAGSLRSLGYEAVTTTHNDVMVGGRKVAGTACYTTPTGTVVHASMLYNVCLDALEQAITPPPAKLQKHAVASVRQRVKNLKEIIDHGTMTEFRRLMEAAMIAQMDKIIIFDLDGTLLNTIDDLGHACNYALEQAGYHAYPIESYPAMVGNGVSNLIRRALPENARTEENIQRVRAHFVPYYDLHNCDYSRPYEGVPELLGELKKRGCRLAVASNKYQAAAETIVARFFPGVFDVVLGEREGVNRKPDPQIVYDVLHVLGSTNQDRRPSVLYVGDSLVDKETAANAAVPFVACSWGFVAKEKLVEAGCARIIDHPGELLNHILAL